MDNSDKKVFIITPIGGETTEIRREAEGVIDAAIIPTLEEIGFKKDNISVAHRISESGSINKQIITRILNDDLAIVNLSRLNPNVMYELAVRHSARKPVIQICHAGTTLPFDIIDERTIFYTNDMKGVLELQSGLRRHVIEALKEENPDNPIYRAREIDLILKESSSSGININEYLLDRLESIEKSVRSLTKTNVRNINNYNNLYPRNEVTYTFHILAKDFVSTEDITDHLRASLFEYIKPNLISYSKVNTELQPGMETAISFLITIDELKEFNNIANTFRNIQWEKFTVTNVSIS